MKRAKIEDALLAMGVPANIKGFTFIIDAVEIIEEKETNVRMVKGIYQPIAERYETTPSCVERAIRHAFEIARAKGDYNTVKKYISFNGNSNSTSLFTLNLMLKREET